MIRLHLGNGEKALNEMDENQFDLAICDPPYGIKRDKQNKTRCKKAKQNRKQKLNGNWDEKRPTKKYFVVLTKVSENQIIWGANYFVGLISNPSKGWIVWDKMQYGLTMSDVELAYSSFDVPTRLYKKNRQILSYQNTFHPAEKPIHLYKWLLKNYGYKKEGTKRTILDTHFGSLSIGIACADMGFDLTAYEDDEDYFQAAVKRLHNHVNQLNAFVSVPEIEVNGEPLNEYMKQLL
ncbi:MAG: site-specific DNA-methyltransferase [Bacteroidetes bacterium]|nr:site-specific DNA-methyltransferase [Bacteroidota bacterium]